MLSITGFFLQRFLPWVQIHRYDGIFLVSYVNLSKIYCIDCAKKSSKITLVPGCQELNRPIESVLHNRQGE